MRAQVAARRPRAARPSVADRAALTGGATGGVGLRIEGSAVDPVVVLSCGSLRRRPHLRRRHPTRTSPRPGSASCPGTPDRHYTTPKSCRTPRRAIRAVTACTATAGQGPAAGEQVDELQGPDEAVSGTGSVSVEREWNCMSYSLSRAPKGGFLGHRRSRMTRSPIATALTVSRLTRQTGSTEQRTSLDQGARHVVAHNHTVASPPEEWALREETPARRSASERMCRRGKPILGLRS